MRTLLILLFASTLSLTNSVVDFEKQTAPMYQDSTAVYELPTKVNISSIQFYVESNVNSASSIWFKIHDGNRTIYTPIKGTNINKLINLSITNLWIVGPQPTPFEDIQYTFQNATKVSIRFVRHGSPKYQEFHVKNLTITGTYEIPLDPNIDSDEDGMIDDHEYIAGTDPYDPNSFLWVAISKLDSNIVIKWPSVENKLYDLLRTRDLRDNFYILRGDIIATPPVNYYYDPISTNSYFYKVKVK